MGTNVPILSKWVTPISPSFTNCKCTHTHIHMHAHSGLTYVIFSNLEDNSCYCFLLSQLLKLVNNMTKLPLVPQSHNNCINIRILFGVCKHTQCKFYYKHNHLTNNAAALGKNKVWSSTTTKI